MAAADVLALPAFLANKPDRPTEINNATALLSALDKTFDLKRDQSLAKSYVETKYSIVPEEWKGTGEVAPGEEFHPSAQDDVDMPDADQSVEDDEADKEARQRLLEAGAEATKKLTKEVMTMPPDVAHIAQSTCQVFRKVWTQGDLPTFRRQVAKANVEIQGINKKCNRKKDAYNIPATEIFSTIPLIRSLGVEWILAKSAGDKKSSDTACRDIAAVTLTLLRIISRSGLSWKLIVTPEVQEFLGQAVQEGLLGEELTAQFQLYIKDDCEYPTAYQNSIMENVTTPLKEAVAATEKNDSSAAIEALRKVGEVNVQIANANESHMIKKNDHVIPLEFSEQNLNDKNFCNALAVYLVLGGYRSIAQSVFGGNVENIEAPDDFAKPMQKALLEYKEPIEQGNPEQRDENPPNTDEAKQAAVPETDDSKQRRADEESAKQPGDKDVDDTTQSQITSTGILQSTVPGVFGHAAKDITIFGKIISVSPVGDRGARCIVNVCTDKTPVYKMMPAGAFGRGMAAKLLVDFPGGSRPDLKSRRATDIKCIKAAAELESQSARKIVQFLVEWKSSDGQIRGEDWVYRSELARICGPAYVQTCAKLLLDERTANLSYLEKMMQKGLHPETQQPLTEADMESMPWLCPIQDLKIVKIEKQEVEAELVGQTSHIVIGGNNLGNA